MKKFRSLLISALTLFYLPAQAQVVINEVCASNFGGFADNYGEYEDWFELYNAGNVAEDISGYYLSDDEEEPMKWEIPAGTTIAPGEFLLVHASDRDESDGTNFHTSFKITQARQEGAVLADPSGNVLDFFMLDIPNQQNHSWGRVSDGAADWGVFLDPSPGAANQNPYQAYATVEITTESGLYSGAVSVEMQTTDPDATIHYTQDGTVPTEASPIYNGPVNVSATTVIKARAFNDDPAIPPSFVETNTYFVDEDHGVYMVSISGDELPTLLGGSQIEPIGQFELFSPEGELLAETNGDFNEHGNDSWAYPQRGVDYITQDEFGYGNELHHQIFSNKDRDGFQRVIMKAAASDNYPFENGGAHIRDAYVQSLSQMADLRVDERTYAPCVMYVNGEYWGVYEIREKVDDLDFTDHYYDQGGGNVDFLKTWGGTWIEYGSDQGWEEIRDFILSNDMTDAANYDYVKDVYNTGSLIDYFVLNTYIVSADWLNWNTGWWRGLNPDGDKKKWRYILWDMDASFDHYINFTNIPDQSPNADPCDPEDLGDVGGQGHVPIWNALIENEEFFADYINRYSDLGSSYFSCEFMISHLDSLIALIEPEMPRHVDRWGGTMDEWQGNVQNIRDFINERCEVITDGYLDCYPELNGPHNIVLMADPPEGGRIDLTSMEIDTYPYDIEYFGGISIDLDADENDGFVFSHWSSNGTTFTPDEFSEEIVVSFTSDDTLTAHFVPDVSYSLTLDVVPEGAGTITIAGITYDNFPTTVELSESVEYSAEITPEFGYEFMQWQSGLVLDPNLLEETVSFSINQNQTLTADLSEITHEVTFEVAPEGVGVIHLEDSTLSQYPASIQVGEAEEVNLMAEPTEQFYSFSHWTFLTNDPVPDSETESISVSFIESDVVIANFTELPNYPILIETEPLNVGWVRMPDTLLREFPYQAVMEGNLNILLEVIERGKFKFSHWEVEYGAPLDNDQLPAINYPFYGPTKLIAHFEERFNAVFIPNSFTPNEDGFNDVLKVYGNEVSEENFRFAIMDRWGKEIWGTTDINEGWNGAMEGSDYYAPPGSYGYFLRYVNKITGEVVQTSGSILLIR